MIVKAVTHIHSDWSYDGNWSLSRIAKYFGTLGYDIVLTSEHDRSFDNERWAAYKEACHEVSTKRTSIVPGIEYSDEDNVIHILVWGVSEFLGKDQETGHLLQMANNKDGICVLAHPGRRNAWKQLDKAWFPLLQGIEFWNRQYDGIAPNQKAIDLLRSNSKIIPFMGLDFHQFNQTFPLMMTVNISGELSKEILLNALRNGQCQSLAFGLSAAVFSEGYPLSFARSAESIRRFLSKIIRR